MKSLPFRIKIALLSTLISGVVLVGFGITAFAMVSRQKIESLDNEIRSLGMRHPGWINNRSDFLRFDDILSSARGEGHREQAILAVKDNKGVVLHTSPAWPKEINPEKLECALADDPKAHSVSNNAPANDAFRGGRGWGGSGRGMRPGGGQAAFTKIAEFQTITTAAGEWRLGMMGSDDITLIVGLNTWQAKDELNHLRNAFLLALPLALLLVGLGGWFVSGRALRPLRVIASTAEQVTARGLDQRIPLSNEDPEISRVIIVLNSMMDRLEYSFRQAIRFSADASHELKTPLAIMQGELENALQDALPDSKEQQIFGTLLEENQRLKTITSGLLLLSRADAGQLKPSRQPINLSSILEEIIEDARALAEPCHLEFDVKIVPEIHVTGDAGLLHTAFLNLFVNAVKYNETGGRVSVALETSGNQVILTIGNSGCGIPESDQELIFNRFHRVDPARQRQVDGIGLGLSLAREIIRAHKGELELKESRPGWTSFQVRMVVSQ